MSKIKSFLFVLCNFVVFCGAKLKPVYDEKIENCAEEHERAGYMDFSGLEVSYEDDTHSFLNGTWKFTHEIKAPWHLIFYTERYDRGTWYRNGVSKDIPNFCAVIHRPSEVWYNIYKTVPGCPLAKGVNLVLFHKQQSGDAPFCFHVDCVELQYGPT